MNVNRGFTLLEVMLSVVLAAVLLAGLWSLLGIYAGLYDKAQSRTEHAQLVRSLQKRLAEDLLSTCATLASESPSSPQGASPQASSDDASSDDVSSDAATRDDSDSSPGSATRDGSASNPAPATTYSGGEYGSTSQRRSAALVGTETTLMLHVLVPVDPYKILSESTVEGKDTDLSQPVRSRVPELRHVSYTFHGSLGYAIPGDQSHGLVRRETEWEEANAGRRAASGSQITETLPAAGNGTGDLAPPIPVVEPGIEAPDLTASDIQSSTAREEGDESVDQIPEVTFFQLRYFDGSAWQTQWDSRAAKSLPVAVEVRFEIEEPSRRHPDPESVATDSDLEPTTDEATETTLREPAGEAGGDTVDVTIGLEEDQPPPHRLVVYLGPRGKTRSSMRESPTLNEGAVEADAIETGAIQGRVIEGDR